MFFKKMLSAICSLGFLSICIPSSAAEKLGQEDYQLLDRLKKETPPVVHRGPLALANLNLNHQGNVIVANPGEKVFGMLNFHYDAEGLEPESLHQIIIGFSEVGPQKCIFNEPGYRCREGIASFFLKVPENPGIYEIQCRFEQAYSPKEAISHWSEIEHDAVMTVGKIVVK